jgi:hypothetical protein
MENIIVLNDRYGIFWRTIISSLIKMIKCFSFPAQGADMDKEDKDRLTLKICRLGGR